MGNRGRVVTGKGSGAQGDDGTPKKARNKTKTTAGRKRENEVRKRRRHGREMDVGGGVRAEPGLRDN